MTPKLIYFQEGKTQSLALPGLALPAFGSAIIDLTKEQADGVIPEGVSEAALELQPNAPSGSIVAELFNFDGGTGGYVVGPSFTSYPAHGTASEWRIDGDFTTTAIVSNAAAEDDKLVLKLYSAAGLYSKAYAIPAGDLVSINLKQLQQDATPDDSGNTLTGASGVMYLTGSHNNLSKLTFDIVVHSTSEADYVGYLNNPCDMVDAIDLFLPDYLLGFGTYDVVQEWDWSISGVQDQSATQTASSNTSIAQISQNSSGYDQVTFTPPADGQSQSVTLYFTPGSVNTTDCEACSYGAVPVQSDTVTLPGVQVTNVDLPSDQVKVTLQGASGSSGTLLVTWDGPSGNQDIADKTEGPGTYIFNPALSGLMAGRYSGVTATWLGASNTYGAAFDALGTYENTQYNTPTESACPTGSGSAYLVNKATCAFEAGSLLSVFIGQSWENGSGITISQYYGYNMEQDAQYCGNHNYLPGDWQGKSFAFVPNITPSCGSAYALSNSTVAISTNEPSTDLECGDQVLIVGLGSGVGTVKEVTDTGGGLSTTQLDNYNMGAACDVNAFPTPGNLQTIRVNR